MYTLYTPNYDTVNLFRARLDKFWMDQAVKYALAADLTGRESSTEMEIYTK